MKVTTTCQLQLSRCNGHIQSPSPSTGTLWKFQAVKVSSSLFRCWTKLSGVHGSPSAMKMLLCIQLKKWYQSDVQCSSYCIAFKLGVDFQPQNCSEKYVFGLDNVNRNITFISIWYWLSLLVSSASVEWAFTAGTPLCIGKDEGWHCNISPYKLLYQLYTDSVQACIPRLVHIARTMKCLYVCV